MKFSENKLILVLIYFLTAFFVAIKVNNQYLAFIILKRVPLFIYSMQEILFVDVETVGQMITKYNRIVECLSESEVRLHVK